MSNQSSGAQDPLCEQENGRILELQFDSVCIGLPTLIADNLITAAQREAREIPHYAVATIVTNWVPREEDYYLVEEILEEQSINRTEDDKIEKVGERWVGFDLATLVERIEERIGSIDDLDEEALTSTLTLDIQWIDDEGITQKRSFLLSEIQLQWLEDLQSGDFRLDAKVDDEEDARLPINCYLAGYLEDVLPEKFKLGDIKIDVVDPHEEGLTDEDLLEKANGQGGGNLMDHEVDFT